MKDVKIGDVIVVNVPVRVVVGHVSECKTKLGVTWFDGGHHLHREVVYTFDILPVAAADDTLVDCEVKQ